MKKSFFLIVSILIFSFFSCTSVPKTSTPEISTSETVPEEKIIPSKEEKLTLVFAGDLMAHTPNFKMSDYSKIWKDITYITKDSDFSFTNIEAPVNDDLPYSSYPDFNMQYDYPQAAIDAGFNVFSIINNHTNDQGLNGIKGTRKWSLLKEKETENSKRPLYFCGINENSGDPISYKVIKKDEWTILYCAVSELLNRPSYKSYLNYVSSSKESREKFTQYLKELRIQNPCDLFILSLHTDEPEYVAEVKEDRKEFYYTLLNEASVDILYSNHPHIIRERELIKNKHSKLIEKAIIYGNGNVISSQRRSPNFDDPENSFDDRGDGFIWKLVFSKKTKTEKPYISSRQHYYITTYINTAWEFIIKEMDDEFISYLDENNRPKWSKYIKSRKEKAERTKETIIWQ